MKKNTHQFNKSKVNIRLTDEGVVDADAGKPTQRRAPGTIQGLSKKLRKNDGQGRGQRVLHKEEKSV
jgi:hypothetical protein